MSDYAVINLKTDPELKKQVTKVAEKLGVSVSAVLNNELRRFASEQSVVFERQEVPNATTTRELHSVDTSIEKGNYHTFKSNDAALDFLADELA